MAKKEDIIRQANYIVDNKSTVREAGIALGVATAKKICYDEILIKMSGVDIIKFYTTHFNY